MTASLLLLSVGLAQGLLPAVLNARRAVSGQRAHTPAMLSAAQQKKASLVDEVKEQMQASSLLFCVRSEGITVNEMNLQRQKFPDTVKIRCVKNTLMHRAAQDFPDFEPVSKTGGELKFSNYWFFVPEEDINTEDITEEVVHLGCPSDMSPIPSESPLFCIDSYEVSRNAF